MDDEPVLLDIFAAWLGASHCDKLRAASNGIEALAAIGREPIDLMITDMRMPIMDGVTLVRSLAGTARSIPSIIFISGFGDCDCRELYSLGVEAFLDKPIRREELIEVLERSLSERSKLWGRSMTISPRQSLSVQVPRVVDAEGSLLRWGRGGFSIRHAKPLTLGRVAFQCSFIEEQLELSGEGYVRWYSRADEAAGIEIAYLEPNCRSWVSDHIMAGTTKSFIPN